MIIWKGWGFLSVVIAVALALACAGFGDTLDRREGGRYGMAVGFAIAAVVNWFLGRWLNSVKREVKAGVLNRHSLFFIPLEWWSVVMLFFAAFYLQWALGH